MRISLVTAALALVARAVALDDAADREAADMLERSKEASPHLGGDDLGYVNLTAKTFTKDSMAGLWFVKFYSPYCPHCQELAPKWSAAIEQLGGSTDKLHYGEVNCVEQGDLCLEQDIKGYPDLRIYKSAENLATYYGKFETSQIVEYAKNIIEYGEQGIEKKADEKAANDADKKHNADSKSADSKSADSKPGKDDEASLSSKASNQNMTSAADTNAKPVSIGLDAPLDPTVPIHIKPENFTASDLPDMWFIKFYSPECPYSKAMAPNWQAAYEELGGLEGTQKLGVQWAQMDCLKYNEFCQSKGVMGWPQTWLYRDADLVTHFEDSRNTEDYVRFARDVASGTNLNVGAAPDQSNTQPPKPSIQSSYKDLDREQSSSPEEALHDEKSKGSVAAPAATGTGSVKSLDDAVRYAKDTFGSSIEGDPSTLVFGEGVESNHGFRTYTKPNAPPPSWGEIKSSKADGTSHVIADRNAFERTILQSNEPWLVKLYSPRCPHCVQMAPEWTSLATRVKNRVNVAEFDCDSDNAYCIELGVSGFPTIRYYEGQTHKPDYQGDRVASQMETYALMQSGGQIIPADNLQTLFNNLTVNNDDGRATFVFVYDESVMPEDWEALSELSSRMAAFDSVLYRANAKELTERLGIHHHGTAFSFLSRVGADDEPYSIPYPFSNVPIKMRDPVGIETWARTVRYASAQKIDEDRLTDVAKIAPYQVLLITEPEGKFNDAMRKGMRSFRELAKRWYDNAEKARINDQDHLRTERLKLRDAAVQAGNLALANQIMKVPIQAPLQLHSTFSFITRDNFAKSFGKFMSTEYNEPGHVMVLDLYRNRYVDSLDGFIHADDNNAIMRAMDYLSGKSDGKDHVRSFSRPVRGMTQVVHVEPTFSLVEKSAFSGLLGFLHSTVFLTVVGTLALWVLYRKFGRRTLRRRLNNEPLLTGKFD